MRGMMFCEQASTLSHDAVSSTCDSLVEPMGTYNMPGHGIEVVGYLKLLKLLVRHDGLHLLCAAMYFIWTRYLTSFQTLLVVEAVQSVVAPGGWTIGLFALSHRTCAHISLRFKRCTVHSLVCFVVQ
eukprot:m.99683 g.99683  ORF g.99683 m.99683 type:complete len:127 (+) comp13149_c0_seq3:1255-1635(+)